MSEDKKKPNLPIELEVNITGKEEIDRLQNEVERLTTERDNLQSKMEIAAEMQFNKAKEHLGAPDSIKTTEELEQWKEQHKEVATGKATLTNQPSPYGNSGVKEFETYEQLAKTLSDRENDPSPEVRREAKQIKDKMFAKMLRGKQETFVMEIPTLANAKWEDQINKQLASEDPRVREEAKERLKAWNNFKVKVKGDSE